MRDASSLESATIPWTSLPDIVPLESMSMGSTGSGDSTAHKLTAVGTFELSKRGTASAGIAKTGGVTILINTKAHNRLVSPGAENRCWTSVASTANIVETSRLFSVAATRKSIMLPRLRQYLSQTLDLGIVKLFSFQEVRQKRCDGTARQLVSQRFQLPRTVSLST